MKTGTLPLIHQIIIVIAVDIRSWKANNLSVFDQAASLKFRPLFHPREPNIHNFLSTAKFEELKNIKFNSSFMTSVPMTYPQQKKYVYR